MGNRFKVNFQRLSRQRKRWRKAVEAAEEDWKDCSPEDRVQMAQELTVLLHKLKSDINDSNIDEATLTELADRVEALSEAVRGDRTLS